MENKNNAIKKNAGKPLDYFKVPAMLSKPKKKVVVLETTKTADV